MKRNLRAIVQIKKNGFIYDLWILAGMGVLASIICLIMARDEIGSSRELIQIVAGTIFGTYIGINIFYKVFILAEEVPRALSFGMTRKTLFIYSRIVDFLEVLAVTGLSLLILQDVPNAIILKTAAISFGIFMWVEALAANNVIKYGKIAYWIFYGTFMVFIFGVPRLSKIYPVVRNAGLGTIKSIIMSTSNQGTVWLGLVGFAIVGLIVNWITFRKMPVAYNL
ncbi:hypothetical protein SAMN02910298_01549 [Pseudobutyrivibrio sp. YE44]|uniref:hypothetical protein n=1 Tax=Pseudobutyrivibrio sp. YE44 TaxID=1520802 RepID=UPI00087EF6F5|nr:hypothetical protein [Pseudobutyrivibrio sp. YE44]SDB31253.1 hypothetical protein SAMN02910298_01549 [Pseudobutyrivibrio sp. YE44]